MGASQDSERCSWKLTTPPKQACSLRVFRDWATVSSLEVDDAADGFTPMHQVEGGVYLLHRHGVGDEVVYVDFALHVPVDDFRDVGTAARPAEGTPLPRPARDELERASGDLLTRACDTDDHRDAPTLVTAF